MKVFFVSGVDTNVGKTYVTRKIIQLLQKKDIKAIALKPIETGVQDLPLDAITHLQDAQKIDSHLQLSDINLYSFKLPSAPYIADCNGSIDLNRIYKQIEYFKNRVDVLLIEGAGGLFVPIKKDFFMISLAQELQNRLCAQSIVVCDDALGMINRFLSAKFILDSLKLQSLFLINVRNPTLFQTINLPFMQNFDFETCIETFVKKIL